MVSPTPPTPFRANSCRDAIEELFRSSQQSLTPGEVRDQIARLYPSRWSSGSVTADMTGSTVNAPSRRHYPSASARAFLFRQDDGRYRIWNPETDGNWQVTETDVELVDSESPRPA
jgi:hypothetical protein